MKIFSFFSSPKIHRAPLNSAARIVSVFFPFALLNISDYSLFLEDDFIFSYCHLT